MSDTIMGYLKCFICFFIMNLFLCSSGYAITRYVSLEGNSIAPYTNWNNAATNISAAVNLSVDGDVVIVSNGIYYIEEEISVTNDILLTSCNGAEETIVDAQNIKDVRCISVSASNAVVEGFSFIHGNGDPGGGIYCDAGTVQDCSIVSNSSFCVGGVACEGKGIIKRCRITHNYNFQSTGGVAIWTDGVLIDSVVAYNSAAHGFGIGGAGCGDGGTIINCILFGNTEGALALIAGNAFNCTIVNNEGGVAIMGRGEVVQNCIIYNNSGVNFSTNGYPYTASYVCTTPAIPGIGNITNDPSLTPSYRLRSDSPCIDAGMTNDVLTDFDGEARWDDPAHSNIVSIVDIGADEFVDTDLDDMADFWETKTFGSMTNSDGTADDDNDNLSDAAEYDNGTNPDDADSDDDELNDGAELNNSTDPLDSDTDDDGMPDGWEVASTINPLLNDAAEDPDSDGMNNIGEYNSDTLPMDSNSVLCMLSMSPEMGGIRIKWQGGLGVWQFLECTEKLPAEEWTPIIGFPPYTMQITNTVIDFPATDKSLFYRIRAER